MTHSKGKFIGYKTSLEILSDITSQYGLAEIEITELLGTDPYKADGNIPELNAGDANREKLKIQRQCNALDVRLEKIKQGRKVAAIASEQRRLEHTQVKPKTVEAIAPTPLTEILQKIEAMLEDF